MKLPTVSALALRRFNLASVVVWALLVVPTVLWWRDSILWVALMSVWANLATSLSSYVSSRAEDAATGDGEAKQ